MKKARYFSINIIYFSSIIVKSMLLMNCGTSLNENKNNGINISAITIDTSITRELRQNEYSLILSCEDSLFLQTKQQINLRVTLMNCFNNKVAKINTGTTHKSQNLGACTTSLFEWPDSVTYLGKFKNNETYDLAILSDKNIQFIKTQTENNQNLINALDSIILSDSRLKNDIKKYDSIMPINEKRLEYFDFKNNRYFIFSYAEKIKEGSFTNTTNLRQFIIFNNTIKPLANACSFEYFIYSVNYEKLFIGLRRGTCCTEESFLNLFEIKEKSLELKYMSNWRGNAHGGTNSMPNIDLQMGN